MAPLGNVLTDRNIIQMMDEPRPCILAKKEDVRPCSLDLRVGDKIWQVAGHPSLAGGFSAQDFIKHYALNEFQATTVTLTPGSVYLAELSAEFALPEKVWGYLNPKSSAGRIDLHCIVIANGGTEFNTVPAGYKGKLYLLMVPYSFPVRDVFDQDFVQLRLYDGPRRPLWGYELEMLDRRYGGLVIGPSASFSNEGVVLHLDLRSFDPPYLVAMHGGKPISVRSRDLDPTYYFRYKRLDSQGSLWLEPGDFLLAPTKERFRVPPHVCVEMVSYRGEHGEYKSHKAGFIDPGFGYGENGEAEAASVVCEITNVAGVRIMLKDGQPIATCVYEYMREVPMAAYGATTGVGKLSNYQGQQGVKLAKFFRPWNEKSQLVTS